MIEFTYQEFQEIKAKGERSYKTLNRVYCPYFKEKVSFGDSGLEHLSFKDRGVTRSMKDQYMRFKLICLAPEIIRLSNTLQGIREKKCFKRVRMHSRTETILKPVTYYEFVAIIKRNRVKIVVKQIDNGKKFFLSIISSWGMDDSNNRTLYEGELG